MMKNNFIVLPRLKSIKLSRRKAPDGPLVLKRVMDELAPSWREHPTMMEYIRRFIFEKDDPTTAKDRSSSLRSCALLKKMEKSLPEKERVHLDVLLTTIEGMRVAALEYNLDSDELIDDFAYKQKLAFKRRLFGAGKPCQE